MESEHLIAVDRQSFDQIKQMAWAANVLPGVIITRLLDLAKSVSQTEQPEGRKVAPSNGAGKSKQIYAEYRGVRIAAEIDLFDAVMIKAGQPAAGRYNTPSAAAMAVVRTLNPERTHPETNGWIFWNDEATRKPLKHAPRH